MAARQPGHLEIMMVFYGTQLPEFLVNLKAARGFFAMGCFDGCDVES
jgi:hypothetical protein